MCAKDCYQNISKPFSHFKWQLWQLHCQEQVGTECCIWRPSQRFTDFTLVLQKSVYVFVILTILTRLWQQIFLMLLTLHNLTIWFAQPCQRTLDRHFSVWKTILSQKLFPTLSWIWQIDCRMQTSREISNEYHWGDCNKDAKEGRNEGDATRILWRRERGRLADQLGISRPCISSNSFRCWMED